MSDDFGWRVEDFLGKPPLDMILEGLGALSATSLEVRDPAGGSTTLGPAKEAADGAESVLSPIQVEGRDAGMVVGYTSEDGDKRVPMTVALAASLLSQFLGSTREVRNLSVDVDRCNRGLSLLDRLGEERRHEDESAVADWFLQEALCLVRASRGVLFCLDREGDLRPLASMGSGTDPEAGILTRRVLAGGETLDLRSLGRLGPVASLHDDEGGCRVEKFLHPPAVAVPVRFGQRPLGVLWASGPLDGDAFAAEDLDLLRNVATQFGLWLWSGRAVDTLRTEEVEKRIGMLRRRLSETYLEVGEPNVDLPWRLRPDEAILTGLVSLKSGRPVQWIVLSTEDDPIAPAIQAAVVRTALEAETPRHEDLARLVEAAAGTLARMEGEGAVTHGLLLLARSERNPGEIEIACRGLRDELAWRRGEEEVVLPGETLESGATLFRLRPDPDTSVSAGGDRLRIELTTEDQG